ncbi:DUF2750 domain-containing protein [Shewanella colwelliana]|uniref:DUF2750 domain-containing protein n=1 Tax=Shewanella colwelliana TaxID=23 RepID=A0A1E5IQH4_SHECO|nr:DUF2750 domain-containing protein [Shewanella colwelliana]MCZ4336181.1 DUF2750 domain-containing protein [Shewanella colwelliana]MDX1279897.1 DUF2750 domain-containing protein [Shewanella colwelliana]OEG72750.1 hypothetical protein BEL05_10780 [Shewanella colwelliana]GIU21620.1 DUF2750 domain-containing protein [Shewanella colwelliana]GIU41357.1 DUF2750 domain-containing protein [Shewanella colwelliana]
MSKSAKDASKMTPEARYDYLVEQAKSEKVLWTLQDLDGCVMLTTEDEDCIPMWPCEESAKQWAVDDWADCTPLAIPLDEWLERWVPGMQDDDLFVAVFPVQEDLGVVIPPYELEQRLTPKQRH